MSAPLSSNNRTTSMFPDNVAVYNGVQPRVSREFTSAPYLINLLAVSSCPSFDATYNGVWSSLSSSLTSAPRSSSLWTTSKRPLTTALCNDSLSSLLNESSLYSCGSTTSGRLLCNPASDGVELVVFKAHTLPECLARKLVTSRHLLSWARSKGVFSLLFRMPTSAPESTSSSTRLRCPFHAAECDGVQPFLSCKLTFAPHLTNSRATSSSPFPDARSNGVF